MRKKKKFVVHKGGGSRFIGTAVRRIQIGKADSPAGAGRLVLERRTQQVTGMERNKYLRLKLGGSESRTRSSLRPTIPASGFLCRRLDGESSPRFTPASSLDDDFS